MTLLKDVALLRTSAYIDGLWVDANDGCQFPVYNPANGTQVAKVSRAGLRETQQAIDAAARALPNWRSRTAKDRATLMERWFELIMLHSEDLATILTTEQGKPLEEARAEVSFGASFIKWFAEEGRRIYGDLIPSQNVGQRLLAMKQPVGVCGAITPWNFPVAMITRKVAPALAAGCTIVVKPAEQTPLCALALAELAQRAGIPPGVINVLPTDTSTSVEVGRLICESSVVRKLSFTGSTKVGRILMQQCAPTIKKLSLELGGHAPFIVFADADLDAAVAGAVISKYRNSGQTCVCTNRIYVHDSIYDTFVSKFAAAAVQLKLGNGLEAGVQQGPLIDEAAVKKVEQQVLDATAKGARIVTGGKRSALGCHFYEPTVLADVSHEMLIAHEETFGPVAPVFRFHTDSEAVSLANDSEYGLAAYFYSRDINRFWRVVEQLEYGMVGVNTGAISNEVSPFGGIKQSGAGREGSKYGIDEYLEMKYVCVGGLS